MGRGPTEAWKFVPKSKAKAFPLAVPRRSLMNFSENPAAKRSEKFCAYVPEMNVWRTEYVRPSPSGLATVYTGWSPNPNEPRLRPRARTPPDIGKAMPAHVYLVPAM